MSVLRPRRRSAGGPSGPQYPYRGWDEAGASGTEADLFFLGVISAIALATAVVLCGRAARDVRAYRKQTKPGLAAAERLWLKAWYCGRCAMVHFAGGPALTLQEFRVRVWTAGGYGGMAERHPAVDLIVTARPDGSV